LRRLARSTNSPGNPPPRAGPHFAVQSGTKACLLRMFEPWIQKALVNGDVGPMAVLIAEEAWLARRSQRTVSVHLMAAVPRVTLTQIDATTFERQELLSCEKAVR